MNSAARLRELLRASEVVVAPGAYDALSARIIERVGFDAVYLTGAGVTGALLGMTDIGLITMTELVQVARNVALAVRLPVICDSDTGFGNPLDRAHGARTGACGRGGDADRGPGMAEAVSPSRASAHSRSRRWRTRSAPRERRAKTRTSSSLREPT